MKSLVAEFVLMASKGLAPEELNEDVFNDAIYFMRTMADESPIGDFEDVYPTLASCGFGADRVFDCPVTEETKEAYAAYLCYCI